MANNGVTYVNLYSISYDTGNSIFFWPVGLFLIFFLPITRGIIDPILSHLLLLQQIIFSKEATKIGYAVEYEPVVINKNHLDSFHHFSHIW